MPALVFSAGYRPAGIANRDKDCCSAGGAGTTPAAASACCTSLRRTLPALVYTALLWSGGVVALDLQLAIVRTKAHGQTVNSHPLPSRATALVDFDLSLGREICRRLGARCLVSYPEFAAIIPGIESKRYHLGFGSYLRTAAREKQLAFSDPLWRSASRLLAFAEVAEPFTPPSGGDLRLETLHDARVAAMIGPQQHAYLQRIATPQRLEVVGRATLGDCLDALKQQQADFALLPVLGAYLVLDPKAQPAPIFLGPGLVDNDLGGPVHIALPKDDDQLRQQVNSALDQMRRDGSYQRLWRRHFPFDSY